MAPCVSLTGVSLSNQSEANDIDEPGHEVAFHAAGLETLRSHDDTVYHN